MESIKNTATTILGRKCSLSTEQSGMMTLLRNHRLALPLLTYQPTSTSTIMLRIVVHTSPPPDPGHGLALPHLDARSGPSAGKKQSLMKLDSSTQPFNNVTKWKKNIRFWVSL